MTWNVSGRGLGPSVVEISLSWDRNAIAIADVGQATMKPLTDDSGNPAHM